jgi:hypothetical protein
LEDEKNSSELSEELNFARELLREYRDLGYLSLIGKPHCMICGAFIPDISRAEHTKSCIYGRTEAYLNATHDAGLIGG